MFYGLHRLNICITTQQSTRICRAFHLHACVRIYANLYMAPLTQTLHPYLPFPTYSKQTFCISALFISISSHIFCSIHLCLFISSCLYPSISKQVSGKSLQTIYHSSSCLLSSYWKDLLRIHYLRVIWCTVQRPRSCDSGTFLAYVPENKRIQISLVFTAFFRINIHREDKNVPRPLYSGQTG